jgi:DNA processing protein
VTEAPFGTRAEPWRFPIRNRVIAALADVVVVIEATARGGARITAEHALAYDRPVLAVPGSRRNPAAAGCNALIADGAHPLLDAGDVFVALGLTAAPAPPPPLPPSDPDERHVLHALSGEPATIDDLCARTSLGAAAVAGAVRRLERLGRVARARGLVWPI